jgi:uncharacterized membrane protein YozB (DUF420 family)
MILLGIHPLLQTLAISLALYAARLGWQRAVSLHYGRVDKFERDRHVLVGSLALLMMLGGVAGGMIMVARNLRRPVLSGLHDQVALVTIPFLLFGLFTGFYLYLNPARRKFLPAIHGGNNLLILFFALMQIYSGIKYYLAVTAG